MYRQQHQRRRLFLQQSRLHVDHRLLQDIGSGALQRRVLRHPLCIRARRKVLRRKLRQRSKAPQQRPRPTVAPRPQHQLFHEVFDAAIAYEIVLDVLLGNAALDPQPSRQPVVGQPVDDAVVDHLGRAALVAGAALLGTKHLDRGAFVNVLAALKAVHQQRV